jgi:ribosomal-protein-alanine N-acetyltransferase
MSHWPYVIHDGELTLRPLRLRDRSAWHQVRRVNGEWLAPWEATRPRIDSDGPLPHFFEMVRYYNKEGRELRSISLGIWLTESGKQRFIGQITLGGIVFGAYRGAHIGYWIDQRYANRGYTTRAVKALTFFAFNELKLHRIEINLRPENGPSRKVAEKSGYQFEGVRPRYLHIAGDWRDHLTFVAENPANFG